MAKLSLKEVNRQREVANYVYYHLYCLVKHPGRGKAAHLQPVNQHIKEIKAGEDPAEFGVQYADAEGNKKIRKFSSLERCQKEVQQRRKCAKEGEEFNILRLGRNHPERPFDIPLLKSPTVDTRTVTLERKYRYHVVDEDTGEVEAECVSFEVDPEILSSVSGGLTSLGYAQGAIYYKGTRPTAQELFTLHQQCRDIPMEDFAAAVMSHLETPAASDRPKKKLLGRPTVRRTEEEKELWYETPAGQHWLEENTVPPIMAHTKKELLDGGFSRHSH